MRRAGFAAQNLGGRGQRAVTAGRDEIEAFIERWSPTGGGERSNCHMFLTELCALIDVPPPEPAVEAESENAYVFERKIPARRLDGPTTANYIDLYKRGCFVLEAKQSAKRLKQLAELKQLGLELAELRTGSGRRGGAQWDRIMRQAREQAETYAKRLPPEEGWPPFLVIVDIGHVIELYADFSLQGKHYAQFPDRQSYRIYLEDLRDESLRDRLRLLWTDPQALNPARRSAEVTREVAELLAKVSKSLETRLIRALPEDRPLEQLAADRHAIAEKVALFLMRCLFTMFAEDVGLLTRASFTGLLEEYKGQADKLHVPLGRLFADMNKGGYSPELRSDILRFNGGLFKDSTALQVDEDDLALLTIAAQRDWKDVEPAIFGTLLERALAPRERAKLGAHYTPRAFVERLVVATIIEPLMADWRDVQAAAAQLVEARNEALSRARKKEALASQAATKGNKDKARQLGREIRTLTTEASGLDREARDLVRNFHGQLCHVRVLDPACGTGNFLYVSMELMKRLEGEILEMLADLGEDEYLAQLDRHTVDPHQFLGLEINPRAVAIAELVLWIGYLQWHFRTRGRTLPAEPVLKNFANIVERDAVLAYDGWELLRDEAGRPIARWDGVTFKLHPVTGEDVPDEAATVELKRYRNPRPAAWPEADFIVGNPPFIGKGGLLRDALGDGYVDALSEAWKVVPRSCDFVMYWWEKCAELAAAQKIKRFGLITTNSIRQSFNRRLVGRWLGGGKPISLVLAIPDHPWVKAPNTANVRIAMTVGERGEGEGTLFEVVSEKNLDSDTPTIRLARQFGKIHADLTIGADVASAKPLRSNNDISWNGVMLAASGFLVTATQVARTELARSGLVRPFLRGRDLTTRSKGVLVIDTFAKKVDDLDPPVRQFLIDHVKPQRDAARDKKFREEWWLFGRNRPSLRIAISPISRFIGTTETSKHRFFQFVDASTLPDHMIVAIAIEDAFFLGVLSSRIHVVWALAAGGRLGVGNDPRYNKTRCFDPFPFPYPPKAARVRIRELGERLDAHRKEVLAKHSQLTMTGLYNVLEKLRAEETLTEAEKDAYEAGLVGVLRQIHDDLDGAVAEAYGWPADLSDEEILERLVALNHERAAEERGGRVRWLRPEFQAPKAAKPVKKAEQIEAELVVAEAGAKKPRLPAALPEQVAAVRAALAEAERAVTAGELSRRFSQGRRAENRVEEVLRTLTLLGQAERVEGGYVLAE